MNVFCVNPKVMFVENEQDVKFVKNYCELHNIDIDINIGDVIDLFRIKKESKTYIVKPLDTIDSISYKLNLPKDEIKKLTNGGNIFIGQKIDYCS